MPPRLLVRAQPLGRSWVPFGTDIRRGIYVEDFQCSADAWGPADASFTLKRSPRASWPDLGFWTPLEVEVENQLVWSGRIIATPGRDQDEDTITVNAQGWQYHLDDRPYSRAFLINDLSRWQDYRALLPADLTTATAATQVSTAVGGITVTVPAGGTTRAIGKEGGIMIDLGPNYPTGGRLLLAGTHSNNSATTSLGVSFMSSIGTITALSTTFVALTGGSTPWGPTAFTWSTASRYIYLRLYDNTGVALTPTTDVWVQFTQIAVADSASWFSGSTVILKASDVVLDAFNRLPQIPAANIGTTSFALPAFSVDQQTARDAILAANAFQDWQARVTADRLLEYRARPQTARLALTDQTAFDDLSAGSGEAIYNEVTYTGTGPDGTPVFVTRTSTAAGLPLTIPDRLGVTKGYTISSSAPLTSTAASQLCDVFLSQHNRTPFKGTVHATSRRSVALNPGGSNCPTYNLLRYPGELCTFKHLQDPDTGGLGRDGRIAKVTYTWASDSAEVDIDSTAGSFEALLSRLAITTAR